MVILALLLAAGGFWLYWEQELPLGAYLPQESWNDVSLLGVVFEGHVNYTVDEDAAEQIITCLNNAKVDRGPRFESTKGEAFSALISYMGDAHSWAAIALIEDGRIMVFNSEAGREYFFEGGGELYRRIHAIAEGLPSELFGFDTPRQ